MSNIAQGYFELHLNIMNIDKQMNKSITSLSSQFADWKTGTAESKGVSSSVYVFNLMRELYLKDSKL